jgi:two-component system response regulator HydG
VGGNKEMDVDVRIIVASNENLQEHIRKANSGGPIIALMISRLISSSRNRKQDIPPFADFFLQKTNDELEKNVSGFEPQVIEMFMNYSWPAI